LFAHCAVRAQQITNAPPTNLTVIVLNGNSGKPIKGIEPLIGVKGKLPIRLNQKTNSNGVAVFHLTDPLPEQIGISFFSRRVRTVFGRYAIFDRANTEDRHS